MHAARKSFRVGRARNHRKAMKQQSCTLKKRKPFIACEGKTNEFALKMRRSFTPVINPDVLCETDVEGGVTVFTIRWIDVEVAVGFGRLVRIFCALSLPTSLTMIFDSTRRDCPRDRCWGNVVFFTFDATLNKFRSLGFVSLKLDKLPLLAKFSFLCLFL